MKKAWLVCLVREAEKTNMSAKVFKQQKSAVFTAFHFPDIGEPKPSAGYDESFEYSETVEVKPFVEIEQETPNADEILQNAQEQAARIITSAEEQYDLIEQAAREKAMSEAQIAVEREVAEKLDEIRANFTEALRSVSGLRDEITACVEKEVVELALEIAKKIVGREVTFDHEIALTLVKVSLKKLHSRPLAQVHLSPEDFAFVESRREQIDFRGSLELVEDRSVSPGGCLIRTETGDVDARIESQFEEIAYGLLGK